MQEISGGVGLHLLLDLHGVKPELLIDLESIKKILVEASRATGATVLSCEGRSFGEGLGVTAMTILSESHCSIHTWPELGKAMLDMFTCGACNPRRSIPVFDRYFKPEYMNVDLLHRGSTIGLVPNYDF